MCGAIDLRELAPSSVGKGAANRVVTLRREAVAFLPAASFELRAPDRATACAWVEVLAARRAKQLPATHRRGLTSAGATVDKVNNNQSSPLGMASLQGYAAVIELLLAAGADVSHKDAWNTPLSWAVSKGHESAAELLRAAGAC